MILPASPFHEMSEWSKINFFYTSKTRAEIKTLYAQAHDREKFGRFAKIVERETGHQLLSVVEDSKIALTDQEGTTAALGFIEPGLTQKVTRKKLDSAIAKHVKAIDRSVTECLKQASLKEAAVDLVILTGGTTEVPLLRNAIRDRFPHAGISEENKLSSVALGLGYDALRRFG
jgi:hypothetical chaperone protein